MTVWLVNVGDVVDSRAPLDVGGLVISFLGAQGAQNLARVHRYYAHP